MDRPHIKSVMTSFPYSISSSSLIAEARNLMGELNIRHLPVIDEHKLVGVVSERDITLAFSLSAHIVDSATVTVGDICTKNPYAVNLETPLGEVVTHMAEAHIGSAIVLKGEKVVGIFTTTDACRYLGEILTDDPGPSTESRRARKEA